MDRKSFRFDVNRSSFYEDMRINDFCILLSVTFTFAIFHGCKKRFYSCHVFTLFNVFNARLPRDYRALRSIAR